MKELYHLSSPAVHCEQICSECSTLFKSHTSNTTELGFHLLSILFDEHFTSVHKFMNQFCFDNLIEGLSKHIGVIINIIGESQKLGEIKRQCQNFDAHPEEVKQVLQHLPCFEVKLQQTFIGPWKRVQEALQFLSLIADAEPMLLRSTSCHLNTETFTYSQLMEAIITQKLQRQGIIHYVDLKSNIW